MAPHRVSQLPAPDGPDAPPPPLELQREEKGTGSEQESLPFLAVSPAGAALWTELAHALDVEAAALDHLA